MGVSIKNYFGLDLWVDGGWYGSLGSKYHVIKDDMRFYTLLPSRYFELRILLELRIYTAVGAIFGDCRNGFFPALLVFVRDIFE